MILRRYGRMITRPQIWVKGCVLATSFLPLTLWFPTATQALSSGDITIEAITPFAPIDDAQCAQGPEATYLQVNITNDRSTPVSGVGVNFTGVNPPHDFSGL